MHQPESLKKKKKSIQSFTVEMRHPITVMALMAVYDILNLLESI